MAANAALQFDGTQNYVDFGTLGTLASNYSSGFYCSFYIQTTQATVSTWGYAQIDGRSTIDLNMDMNGTIGKGFMRVYFIDNTGTGLVAGCTADTGFADGGIHQVEVTAVFSTQTINVQVDGNNKAITYNTRNLLHNFNNYSASYTIGNTLSGVVDNFQLGTTSSNVLASYKFNEGHDLSVMDSKAQYNAGTLTGTPPPSWVAGIAPQIDPIQSIRLRPRAFAPGLAR